MKTLFNRMAGALFAYITLFPGIAFADWDTYDGWHMGPHMMGWTGMGYGWSWMIFLWLAVLVILVMLIRWMRSIAQNESRGSVVPKTALDILKERFARGEIDEDEFMEKRRMISGN